MRDRDALEVGIEIHQLPGDCEPHQAHAGQGDGGIVQLCPNPPVGGAPTLEGVQASQEHTQNAEYTDDSEPGDPGGESIEPGGIIGQRQA